MYYNKSSKCIDTFVSKFIFGFQLSFSIICSKEFLKTKQLSNGSGAGSRNTGCEDTFQYYFTAEGLVNENDAYSKYEPFAEFASIEKVQRRESESCSDSVRLDPIYETGDVVDCWRPSMFRYVPSKWY